MNNFLNLLLKHLPTSNSLSISPPWKSPSCRLLSSWVGCLAVMLGSPFTIILRIPVGLPRLGFPGSCVPRLVFSILFLGPCSCFPLYLLSLLPCFDWNYPLRISAWEKLNGSLWHYILNHCSGIMSGYLIGRVYHPSPNFLFLKNTMAIPSTSFSHKFPFFHLLVNKYLCNSCSSGTFLGSGHSKEDRHISFFNGA